MNECIEPPYFSTMGCLRLTSKPTLYRLPVTRFSVQKRLSAFVLTIEHAAVVLYSCWAVLKGVNVFIHV